MRARPFPFESANYPFNPSSTYRVGDTVHFPRDFIADANIYATEKGVYEITRIVKTRTAVEFTIGTRFKRDLIFGHYLIAAKEETVNLVDQHGRPAGLLLVKEPSVIGFLPEGEFDLPANSLRFEVSCHVAMAAGTVTGLVIESHDETLLESTGAAANARGVDGDVVSRTFVSGDITLRGTQGVVLERQDNKVFVHFTGEPYYNLWARHIHRVGFRDDWVARIGISIVNPDNPQYSTAVWLHPDENGHIPIFMTSMLLAYGDALRFHGERGRLTIGLAGGR